MNRIDKMFSTLTRRNEAALIPFVTTGDPDLPSTEAICLEMAEKGADLIELGLPFSDPLADGPTIQAASQRALKNNITPLDLFEMVARIRQKTCVPLVLMGYFNPVYQYGLERFARDAAEAGLDGTIIPDLPLEEAGLWMKTAKEAGLANILLVAPNTPEDRLERIARATSGFLYYVSVTGITGARATLPDNLAQGLRAAKRHCKKPVAVGFGISRPDQVEMLSQVADGIIVGSAIVRIIEENTVSDGSVSGRTLDARRKVGDFVKELKSATLRS